MFLDGARTSDPPQLVDALETNRRVIARLTTELARDLTAEQKQHFTDETNEYIRMFTELAENH